MTQLAGVLKMPKWKSLRASFHHILVIGMQCTYHAPVNAVRVSSEIVRDHSYGADRGDRLISAQGSRWARCSILPSLLPRPKPRKKSSPFGGKAHPCVKKMTKGANQGKTNSALTPQAGKENSGNFCPLRPMAFESPRGELSSPSKKRRCCT